MKSRFCQIVADSSWPIVSQSINAEIKAITTQTSTMTPSNRQPWNLTFSSFGDGGCSSGIADTMRRRPCCRAVKLAHLDGDTSNRIIQEMERWATYIEHEIPDFEDFAP